MEDRFRTTNNIQRFETVLRTEILKVEKPQKKARAKWTLREYISLLDQLKRGLPVSQVVIPNRTTSSVRRRLDTLHKQVRARGVDLDDATTQALFATKQACGK